MNRHRQLLPVFAAIATGLTAYGCDSKAPGADIVAKPTENAQSSQSASTKTEAPAPPKTDIDRSKLPANLQTDAYHYFGLGYTKPLDMEMKRKPDTGVLTGSMSLRMSKVDQASATFVMETTGALNDSLGDETYVLKPDGIYAVASSKEKLAHPEMELPTNFVSGKPWSVDSTDVGDSGKLRQRIKYHCAGPDTVKIGATKYAALRVEGEGTFTGPALSSTVVLREWFVKDIGGVKMELVQTPKGKPPVTLEMIWKPTDSKAKS